MSNTHRISWLSQEILYVVGDILDDDSGPYTISFQLWKLKVELHLSLPNSVISTVFTTTDAPAQERLYFDWKYWLSVLSIFEKVAHSIK